MDIWSIRCLVEYDVGLCTFLSNRVESRRNTNELGAACKLWLVSRTETSVTVVILSSHSRFTQHQYVFMLDAVVDISFSSVLESF